MKTIKVRPVLIKSETATSLLKENGVLFKFNNNLNFKKQLGDEFQNLILISLEDETICQGDSVVWKGQIFEVCNSKAYSNTNFIRVEYCNKYNIPKVIATQDKLSPELIQQLIDEYNNDGMKDFEIEMKDWCDYDDDCTWGGLDKSDWRIKLTNGFVTVVEKEPHFNKFGDSIGHPTLDDINNIILNHKEKFQSFTMIRAFQQDIIDLFKSYKEPILYTEEEVLNLLDKLLNIDCSFTKEDGSQCITQKGLPYTLQEWFNQNKKK